MIKDEIKEAVAWANALTGNWMGWNYAAKLRDAYIDAEAGRRKAEFKHVHGTWFDGRQQYCRACGKYDHEYDPHHNFTDDQWRAEVLGELEA